MIEHLDACGMSWRFGAIDIVYVLIDDRLGEMGHIQ